MKFQFLISVALSALNDIHKMQDCPIKTIGQVNEKLLPVLDVLRKTSLFRYYKANLNKDCPFWNESKLCSLEDCTVVEAQVKNY